MALNIKSAEAHRLAQELAELTGKSLTQAVTDALRDRLESTKREHGKESLVDQLQAIGRAAAPHFKEPYRSADHGDLLYDERGLPK
jgi:antitoxin VapB